MYVAKLGLWMESDRTCCLVNFALGIHQTEDNIIDRSVAVDVHEDEFPAVFLGDCYANAPAFISTEGSHIPLTIVHLIVIGLNLCHHGHHIGIGVDVDH